MTRKAGPTDLTKTKSRNQQADKERRPFVAAHLKRARQDIKEFGVSENSVAAVELR